MKFCIVFEFFAFNVPLNFRSFMCHFGCYYFGSTLKDFRLTLSLIWVARTLLMQKGNCTFVTLFHIGTAFRRMTRKASENLCALFVPLNVRQDIRCRFTRQAYGNQFYIFIICKLHIFHPAVCTIRDYDIPLFLTLHLFKILPDKPAVTMSVFLILVLGCNRTIHPYRFFEIGTIFVGKRFL